MLRYIRYKILRVRDKIFNCKIFMSKERKKERRNNADSLFKEIMKNKFDV